MKRVGVFTVEVKLRNWQNRFLPLEKRGKEVVCKALVDTGAVDVALPREMVEELKLEQIGKSYFRVADGDYRQHQVVGIVEVEVGGRTCQVQAIELPYGVKPLLGIVPLQEMDWHISPLKEKLVPNPESPHEPVFPLY